jgi:ubiquitin-protein ligase
MATVARLSFPGTYPTRHNNVSPIVAHWYQCPRLDQLAQVCWHTLDMMWAGVVQLHGGLESCALCFAKPHRSFSITTTLSSIA